MAMDAEVETFLRACAVDDATAQALRDSAPHVKREALHMSWKASPASRCSPGARS